jgi:hypothetical protein
LVAVVVVSLWKRLLQLLAGIMSEALVNLFPHAINRAESGYDLIRLYMYAAKPRVMLNSNAR